MSGGSDVADTDLIPCRSCGALVIMATHCRTGKVAPITAALPTDDSGTIDLWHDARGKAMYQIVKPGPDHDVVLRRSHFADCTNAAAHRRKS